ncbi:hypothetical protein E2562_022452 [Oryza meyeriana var. granulata]|uniref:Uncharacterized protein n=1 Tax=Oryza meyeriana var. granulata TaxID=110450 RepID=A0A6G1BP92_9ORYZ|nr:hypothetical protein E2562_022452 [Oryza meyeriana var. granulata]
MAGQQLRVTVLTARQHPGPSRVVSLLRKKRTISSVHDRSSVIAPQHSTNPPPPSSSWPPRASGEKAAAWTRAGSATGRA